MNHASFREMISSYVDGEIDKAGAQRVLDHLRECGECRLFHEQIQKTSAAIKDAADYRLADGFTYQVLRSARSASEESRAWLPVERIARRFLLGLSAAVMLFVSVSMVAQSGEQVVMEPYLSGEPSDSSVTRTLLNKEDLSKDDILLAAVTRK